jgi:uncharacterized protein (UPF0332 family)
MSEEQVVKLIRYRIQQAQQALQEAEVLYHASLFLGSINRAYYAMFYAIQALIVLQNEVTSKHSGAIAFFDRELIKTGIFPKNLSRSLHLAFDRRQMNDYGEVSKFSQPDVEAALTEAKEFVEAVKEYLNKKKS